MFTGIVTDVGTIAHVADTAAGRELRIQTSYNSLVEGESIAVEGVCLTVRLHGTDGAVNWFDCAAVVTTVNRTAIGSWEAGRKVNLERALRAGDRLGGHIVQGHVDATGVVLKTETVGDALLIDIEVPNSVSRLLVPQGSITINGVSLTVNSVFSNGVQLSIIEYTSRHTTLGELKLNDHVHIETDVLARHVEQLLAPHLAALNAHAL